jgi:hypothetical protein
MMRDKNQRGSASQYFVAAELCRRGFPASITMGNTSHVDILCSNAACSRFVHVQVKTFVPKERGMSCHVGRKAELDYGSHFFWVLCGLPLEKDASPIFYIVPSAVMAKNVAATHAKWLATPGRKGQEHSKENEMRVVEIRSKPGEFGWDLDLPGDFRTS